ncbi:kinase-like protein [Hypomontagnella monticulosa]|nr:kinase-like protein [Hypomontagnella monticulosa]
MSNSLPTTNNTPFLTNMEYEELAQICSAQEGKPLLITSLLLGLPPYVLDPQDLTDSFNPFPSVTTSHFRQIDEDTIVKYGPHITLAEAEAMDYISRNTSIKCPKVIGAYLLNDEGYIIMSLESGKSLSHFWENATNDKKEAVIKKLEGYISEMRNIKGDYVGGFNRNPCVAGEFMWDFHQIDYKYGPYPDEHGFNEGLMEALSRASPGAESTDPESATYNQRYATRQLVHSLRNHEIVFTHGDLNSGNILVQDDLTVVILDWYTAGFYPAYWEWYKATWHGVFKPSFIRQVERYIPPYWIEANIMNQIFNKIIG